VAETIGTQLLDDLEEDDRMMTVETIRIIYPELEIRGIFEILDSPLLIETLILELGAIPDKSIKEI
jgi:hypothetical protein